jgi:hypothetical protein
MIKIFADSDDITIINAWRETNSITADVTDPSLASDLGLTEFPVVVKVEGGSVVKTYGTGIPAILNIAPDQLEELST